MDDPFDKTLPAGSQDRPKGPSGSTLQMGSGSGSGPGSGTGTAAPAKPGGKDSTLPGPHGAPLSVKPDATRQRGQDAGMPGALDATIAADNLTGAAPPAAPPAAARSAVAPPAAGAITKTLGVSGSPQTTVLPRVEFDGRTPKFVVESTKRYQVMESIGEGGVGEVMSARDNDIIRRVALKRLRPNMQDPEALARFVDEIRTTGRLEHPNIIPIHDVGVDEKGNYYFIMKYVDGETLESIIEKLRAGDPAYHKLYGYERRVEVFKGVLEAVAYAHSQGYIHRDIKPSNVMVGPFGEVLLMDWGIAKAIRDSSVEVDTALLPPTSSGEVKEEDRKFQTQMGSLIGTPAYMAPEQADGKPADERSDVYALSVLLHEFLALRHYLADRRTLHETLLGVKEQPVPHATFAPKNPHQPTVPADLGWFIEGGVAKDPAKRYPSVEAMIERLDKRAEGHIPIQCPMTLVKRVTHGFTRALDHHPMFVLFAVCVVLLAAVAAIAFSIWKLT